MLKRKSITALLILALAACLGLAGCGAGDGQSSSSGSDNSASAGSGSADEAFEQFLYDGYYSADDYVDGLPVFYDRWEDGTVDESGGHTWIEYIVADFDADGQDEMLLYQTFYTGEYYIDGPGSLIMYECEGGEVVMKSFCYYRGDLHSDKVAFYDNMVVYDERWYDGGSSLSLLMFDNGMRSSFGLDDGQYLSYEQRGDDFDHMDRNICSAFSVDDNRQVTNEEYMEESESILTGDFIDVEIYSADEDGISEAF